MLALYYLGQKIETTARRWGTGARLGECSLEHARACSFACVAVSIFSGQGK